MAIRQLGYGKWQVKLNTAHGNFDWISTSPVESAKAVADFYALMRQGAPRCKPGPAKGYRHLKPVTRRGVA